MSSKEPMNMLERTLVAVARGPEARPKLFRQLRGVLLHFLLPYHPEMEGKIELKNGMRMDFIVWKGKKGEFIPIFSCLERLNEAVARQGLKKNPYCAAEALGATLFQVLACQKYGAVLNPGCGPVEFYIDRNAVRGLADGSILNPIQPLPGPRETRRMIIVKPEDYPTDFLQPLFQFLRGRPEALAGWLFRFKTPKPPLTVEYGFMLVASGNWEQLKQDFGVVAHSLCMDKPEMYYGVQVTHPDDPAIATLLAPLHPFFLAPGYKLPEARKSTGEGQGGATPVTPAA